MIVVVVVAVVAVAVMAGVSWYEVRRMEREWAEFEKSQFWLEEWKRIEEEI